MESGRVVMDGVASDLANNEDVKEFSSVGGGERKSFKDVKSYKRHKRCGLPRPPMPLQFTAPWGRPVELA